MRCACGAMLAGVDLVRPQAAGMAADLPPRQTPAAEAVVCAYEDCGQANPAGAAACLYCNRPLAPTANDLALTAPGQFHSLLNLPSALKARYRILRPLPTRGAEAELLLVEQLDGGPARVAKIYRQGIQPRREVQERIARIAVEHRVEVLDADVSDGYAYEVMEFCSHGCLREMMGAGPLPAGLLQDLVRELAPAIAGVHAVGLVHRDMKPENILVRSRSPLNLVLTDFGVASVLDATQRFTGVARTLPYASPESLSGVIDGKSDYWAFGMIMLEGALGQHPFAGLSEAVILHHLTTRSIDQQGIGDRKLKKLVRGLLQRDPKLRWGAAELVRWLADDDSLAEPADEAAGSSFAQPYHLASERCHTPEQLAVALARNWREGVADTANGQLLAWFRDVQKDQNVVRLMLELRHDLNLSPDRQLLNLILHLAPGIPPVWRGETIELPAILSHANLALKGDLAAAKWLDLLYQNRVLEVYAKAGNQDVASLVQRWNLACDQFDRAWNDKLHIITAKGPARHPREVVNFDALMYGGDGPSQPPMASMHARLLAIAYDPSWSERLRKRLLAELAGLTVYCNWFAELGDPRSLDAPSLLVLESLLPEARKAADRQIKTNQLRQEDEINECHAMRAEIEAVIASLRGDATETSASPAVCTRIRNDIDKYFSLIARVRASGRSDLLWQEMKKSALRTELTARQMLMLVDLLGERRAVNAGWFSLPVLGFLALAMVLLSPTLGVRITYLLIAGTIGIAAWRLLPNLSAMRKIRELGNSL
jgi:tRNA A-37 threonylcarbamoyl transferase component Bud32